MLLQLSFIAMSYFSYFVLLNRHLPHNALIRVEFKESQA